MEILKDFVLNFNKYEVFLQDTDIRDYINEEVNIVKEFLIYELEKKNFIGKHSIGNANKLISFVLAKDCGLNIPDYGMEELVKNEEE